MSERREESTQETAPSGGTVVVPAYDEEGGITVVVERLARLDLGRPLELVVVDDGSKADTGRILEQLRSALKTGIRAAAHPVIVITDADGTYPEDRIVDLLARVDDGAEMAVGARTGEDVHIPWQRRPAKAALFGGFHRAQRVQLLPQTHHAVFGALSFDGVPFEYRLVQQARGFGGRPLGFLRELQHPLLQEEARDHH